MEVQKEAITFTQETTMHGVQYIGKESQHWFRRLYTYFTSFRLTHRSFGESAETVIMQIAISQFRDDKRPLLPRRVETKGRGFRAKSVAFILAFFGGRNYFGSSDAPL